MIDDELAFAGRDKTAAVGIGQTAFSRDSGRSVLSLATEASLKAIADAGLDRGRHRRHRPLVRAGHACGPTAGGVAGREEPRTTGPTPGPAAWRPA